MHRLIGLLATLTVAHQNAAPQSAAHRVMNIAVTRDIHLEVLDWGGSGPALVFLAGFGNTAHVFDGFAPQFTTHHHVFAITRRGFGTSSRPSTGYDTNTLTSDIIGVLDSLGVRRATFAGHSFAGSELGWLGAHHADRVHRLIYLDASYDYARLFADTVWKRAFPVPQPPVPTTPGIAQLRRWFSTVMGPGVPDDEIRALTNDGASAALSEPLQRGAAPVRLTHVAPGVLVIWALPRSVEDQYPYWLVADSAARVRLQTAFTAQQSIRSTHLEEFRTQLPHSQFVTIRGGRHYVFLSHPRQVADAIDAFLLSSRPPPNEH